MDAEKMELLLVAGRNALSQALRQWQLHANDARDRDEYHLLGEGDDMEDRVYLHAKAALKRLGAAADELEDARIARRTAFAAAHGSETPLKSEPRVDSRARGGGVA